MTADPSQLKKLKEIGFPGALFSVARVPNSTQLYFGSSDFNVYSIDVGPEGNNTERATWAGHTSYVTSVALAGEQLISGGWDGKLIWWDVKSEKQIRSVDAHSKWIRGIAVSPDGKWLVSVGDDMVCRRWDVATGEKLSEWEGHDPITPHHYPSMLFACAISPNGQQVATADKQGKIIVWEVATGNRLAHLEAAEMYTWDPKARRHSIGGARSLAFSPDGSLLAVGGMGQVGNIDHLGGKTRIEIFDWTKQEQTHLFEGDNFKGLIEHLQFHPQRPWLLAAGGDHGGLITVLDLEKKNVIKEEKGPSHIHSIATDEKWETLYCAGHGKITIWEMKALIEEGAPPEPDEEAAKKQS